MRIFQVLDQVGGTHTLAGERKRASTTLTTQMYPVDSNRKELAKITTPLTTVMSIHQLTLGKLTANRWHDPTNSRHQQNLETIISYILILF